MVGTPRGRRWFWTGQTPVKFRRLPDASLELFTGGTPFSLVLSPPGLKKRKSCDPDCTSATVSVVEDYFNLFIFCLFKNGIFFFGRGGVL